MDNICFKLNGNESLRYNDFCKAHMHLDTDRGAIGGGISIIFKPTSLGSFIKVKCDICNQSGDITDVCNW